jgi:hypothetical protein
MTQPESVHEATRILLAFSRKPASVPPLLQQMTQSPAPPVRQMAAIVLRKRIPNQWRKLNPAQQRAVKETLLQTLTREPVHVVRVGVAAVITVIAKQEVSQNRWPELFDCLLGLLRGSEQAPRQLAMMLFAELCDELGPQLRPMWSRLLPVFQQGLADKSNVGVRVQALRGLALMIEWVEEASEAAAIGGSLPLVLSLVQEFAGSRDDENADDVISTSLDLLEAMAKLSLPAVASNFERLMSFLLGMVRTPSVVREYRMSAAELVVALIENKSKKLERGNVVQEIVKAACMLMSVPDEDMSRRLVDSEDDPSTVSLGITIMDALALKLPSLCFAVLRETIFPLLRAEDFRQRKGALHVVGCASEGCSDDFLFVLPQLAPAVLESLGHGHVLVRAAACFAFAQLFEHLGDVMVPHMRAAMGGLARIVENEQEPARLRALACDALQQCVLGVANASDDTTHLEGLINLFGRAFPKADPELKNSLLLLLRSLAESSSDDFNPYVDRVMELVFSLLRVETLELLPLRATATEVAAAVFLAVGPELFGKPRFDAVLARVYEGIKLEFPGLTASSFNFFAVMLRVLGPRADPLLEQLIRLVVETLSSANGIEVVDAESDIRRVARSGFVEAQDKGADSDPDDEQPDAGELDRRVKWAINNGAVDEKISALRTLENAFEYASPNVLKWAREVLHELESMRGFQHTGIREATIDCYHALLKMLRRAFPAPGAPTPGKIVPLRPEARVIADQFLVFLITALEADPAEFAVSSACRALTQGIYEHGLGLFSSQRQVEQLVVFLRLILSYRAKCQRLGNEDADYEGGGGGHHPGELVAFATDLIAAIAAFGGAAVEPLVVECLPPALRLIERDGSSKDTVSAMGMLAEVLEAFGRERAHTIVDSVLPYMARGLESDDLELLSNSAYGVGVAFACCAQRCAPALPKVLPALERLLGPPPSSDAAPAEHYLRARDNAVSAVAHILLNVPEDAVPLARCAAALVAALPLREDVLEGRVAYPNVCKLVARYPRVFLPHAPTLVRALGGVLMDSPYQADVLFPLASLVQRLVTECAQQVQPVLAALAPEQQTALQRRVRDILSRPPPSSPQQPQQQQQQQAQQ